VGKGKRLEKVTPIDVLRTYLCYIPADPANIPPTKDNPALDCTVRLDFVALGAREK